MIDICMSCNRIRTPEEALNSGRCANCGSPLFFSKSDNYNATKALQQEIVDMVEDALVRAGIKYIRVYFDEQGTLIIEKERE